MGEFGTGEETSEDPTFDSFRVRFLAEEPKDVSIPVIPPEFVEEVFISIYRTTLKIEYNTSAMGRYGDISGY